MKPKNRIALRWILPVLILMVVAAVCFALASDGDTPDVPGQTSAPPGTSGPTAASQAQTLPGQTEGAEQTEPVTQPPETMQTEPQAAVTQPPETVQTEPVPTQPSGPEEDIRVREFARFSGQYVEDGRDELVENVAAILVTNRSDQFLDLATLTYDVDGAEAVFVVTGLPAGSSAWVMESQRLVISDDAQFTFLDCMTSFREGVTAQPELVSVYADANMLTVVNDTGQTLEQVFVYYKNLHTDGNFFGGITYRVDFGTLEPGAQAEALAGHFSSDVSQIVRIGWLGQ